MSDLAKQSIRLAPNDTNLGLFKINQFLFEHKTDLKNVRDMSNLVQNLAQFEAKYDIPDESGASVMT